MPSVEISRFRKLVQRVEDLAREYGIELRRRTLKDGGLTGQTIIKVNSEDLNYNWGYYNWNNVTGKPTVFATNIANVSGLTAALAGKAPVVTKTITPPGTTGAQTINTQAGTVNIASGIQTLVVTNSLVTANSLIFCTLRTQDSTAVLDSAVPASGSFTIRLSVAATAETSIAFLVI